MDQRLSLLAEKGKKWAEGESWERSKWWLRNDMQRQEICVKIVTEQTVHEKKMWNIKMIVMAFDFFQMQELCPSEIYIKQNLVLNSLQASWLSHTADLDNSNKEMWTQ